MAFSNTRVDFYNDESYDEKLHGYALEKGLLDVVTYGLDWTGVALTNGTFSNGGALGILGNEGETLTQAEIEGYDNNGYLTIHTIYNGRYSKSEVIGTTERMYSDRTKPTTDKYFTIYKLKAGSVEIDYRKPWPSLNPSELTNQKVLTLEEIGYDDSTANQNSFEINIKNIMDTFLPEQRPIILGDYIGGNYPTLAQTMYEFVGFEESYMTFTIPYDSSHPAKMELIEPMGGRLELHSDYWNEGIITKNGDFLKSIEDRQWIAYQSPNGAILNKGTTYAMIPHPVLLPRDFKVSMYKFSGRSGGNASDGEFQSFEVNNNADLISIDGETPINQYFAQQSNILSVSSNSDGGRFEVKKWNLNDDYNLIGNTEPRTGGSEAALRTMVFYGNFIARSGVNNVSTKHVLKSVENPTEGQKKQLQLLEEKAIEEMQNAYNSLFTNISEEDKTKARVKLTEWLNKGVE